MTPRNLPLPAYRPTVWCCNPACHAPVPAEASECPECGEPVAKAPQVTPAPAQDIEVDALLREGRY